MYGALIVEDTNEKYDKDYTLMLDEWITDKEEINNQLKEMTKGQKGNKSKDNENKKRMMIGTVWIIPVWTWAVIRKTLVI